MERFSKVTITDPRYGIESDCECRSRFGLSRGGTIAEGGRW
jgi:hypothetical protein